MTSSSPPTRDTSRARPQPCAPPRGRQVQEKSSTHAEEVSTQLLLAVGPILVWSPRRGKRCASYAKAAVHPEHRPHVPLRLRVRRNPAPPADRRAAGVVGPR